jgi:hypothetical protein
MAREDKNVEKQYQWEEGLGFLPRVDWQSCRKGGQE